MEPLKGNRLFPGNNKLVLHQYKNNIKLEISRLLILKKHVSSSFKKDNDFQK